MVDRVLWSILHVGRRGDHEHHHHIHHCGEQEVDQRVLALPGLHPNFSFWRLPAL